MAFDTNFDYESKLRETSDKYIKYINSDFPPKKEKLNDIYGLIGDKFKICSSQIKKIKKDQERFKIEIEALHPTSIQYQYFNLVPMTWAQVAQLVANSIFGYYNSFIPDYIDLYKYENSDENKYIFKYWQLFIYIIGQLYVHPEKRSLTQNISFNDFTSHDRIVRALTKITSERVSLEKKVIDQLQKQKQQQQQQKKKSKGGGNNKSFIKKISSKNIENTSVKRQQTFLQKSEPDKKSSESKFTYSNLKNILNNIEFLENTTQKKIKYYGYTKNLFGKYFKNDENIIYHFYNDERSKVTVNKNDKYDESVYQLLYGTKCSQNDLNKVLRSLIKNNTDNFITNLKNISKKYKIDDNKITIFVDPITKNDFRTNKVNLEFINEIFNQFQHKYDLFYIDYKNSITKEDVNNIRKNLLDFLLSYYQNFIEIFRPLIDIMKENGIKISVEDEDFKTESEPEQEQELKPDSKPEPDMKYEISNEIIDMITKLVDTRLKNKSNTEKKENIDKFKDLIKKIYIETYKETIDWDTYLDTKVKLKISKLY